MKTSSPKINLEPAFLQVAKPEIDRMFQWFYKTPMLISEARFTEMKITQQIIHKAILYFVNYFADYESLLPLSNKAREIVDIAAKYPYRAGTYRPDFVITETNEIKICEINARFPLNGYFNAAITECIANRLAAEQGFLDHKLVNRKFLDYLIQYFGRFDQVCVLKSPLDRPMDLRLYAQIFEKAGIPCTVIAPSEVNQRIDLVSGSAVINEINQMDLELLDNSTIEIIAAANGLNDLRSIFLVHDKRFMAVLSNHSFLADFLTNIEIEFLARHIIPTYTRWQSPKLWEKARADKEHWIIKPYLLGKSEKILAGCVTDEKRWRDSFDSRDIDQMILQPFIPQKRFEALLDGRIYQDYVVGTFLCFDNEFFGPGRFRTSSFPVTNQGDDRKVAPFIINQPGQLDSPFILE